MESRGAAEFARHFFGKHHWELDVTYRVQNNMPVFNRLMDPMELSESQLEVYANRPSKGKSEGFSFPEDLLPACTQVDSSVPLLTMVNCLLELCRCGGSYTLLRRLWGYFRATLGKENPLYKLNWDRAESLVSFLSSVSIYLWYSLSLIIVVMIWCVSLTPYSCHVPVLFQSLLCRAIFPRLLRSLFARVAAFKDYSLEYEERSDGLYCFVRTWDDANLQDVCVRVESLGQQVPNAELSCMSRAVDSLSSCMSVALSYTRWKSNSSSCAE